MSRNYLYCEEFLSLCKGISQVGFASGLDVENSVAGAFVMKGIRAQYNNIFKELLKASHLLNKYGNMKKMHLEKILELSESYNLLYDAILQLREYFPGKFDKHILPLKAFGDITYLRSVLRAALVPEEDIVDIMLERILATNDATSFIHYANFFGVIFIALATKKDIREGRIKKYVYGMISSKNDFDRAKILCQCANLEVVIAYLEIKNFSPEQILELMDVTIENFDVEVKEYNSIITALTKKYYILTGQSAPEKYLKL